MERHCYLRNIQDLLSEWKTPYESPLTDQFLPFGADGRISPYVC